MSSLKNYRLCLAEADSEMKLFTKDLQVHPIAFAGLLRFQTSEWDHQHTATKAS